MVMVLVLVGIVAGGGGERMAIGVIVRMGACACACLKKRLAVYGLRMLVQWLVQGARPACYAMTFEMNASRTEKREKKS
jgi:hypothetical protein